MYPVKFISREQGGGLWWPAGLLLNIVLTLHQKILMSQIYIIICCNNSLCFACSADITESIYDHY